MFSLPPKSNLYFCHTIIVTIVCGHSVARSQRATVPAVEAPRSNGRAECIGYEETVVYWCRRKTAISRIVLLKFKSQKCKQAKQAKAADNNNNKNGRSACCCGYVNKKLNSEIHSKCTYNAQYRALLNSK